MIKRFDTHTHTESSNMRLLDSNNKYKKVIKRAIELGMSGIAFTEHEFVGNHPDINEYHMDILKEYPDFKVGLGNEIYLTQTRDKGQRYYHFILIAKNKQGQKMLRQLSSNSWLNSYYDGPMERVPTLYSELEDIVKKNPGNLIATTACLGGYLSVAVAKMIDAEVVGDEATRQEAHQEIVNFVLWNKELFGDDFYIECAPAASMDQIKVNKRLKSVAEAFQVKMVIGSDAHYLTKEDRYTHKAFLNSQYGEREVDDFYEYCYLQDDNDVRNHLYKSDFEDSFIDQMYENSNEISDKIENYSLLHSASIPKVEIKNYDKKIVSELKEYPIIQKMFESDVKSERYWINECYNDLLKRKETEVAIKNNYENYLARLEEEADIQYHISNELGINMFNYPITLQHYINLFWECGSTVGAGRGSSCAGLSHYLLGVTQLDPLVWDLPFWRYSNKSRVELGDIDIDICPSKRPMILQKIKEERGVHFKEEINDIARKNLGCTLIATFGTESTKSAILTACRGYRSENFPDGIDVDTGQYLSSLVPQERGFLWSLEDVVNGDPDKGRKPVRTFLNEVNQYPGLLDVMLGVEGLISRRGSHAAGVIFFDEDPYELGCFMKTPTGDVITQYNLKTAEKVGLTKYDFLVTEIQDKITETINLLQANEEIDSSLTLKEAYDKYLHPSVLPIENKEIWKAIEDGSVLNVFQLDSDVGLQASKKLKPQSIIEMSDLNSLMRLMAEKKGAESPIDKYIRFKNDISLWYAEMDEFGLTKEEQEILKPYFEESYGVPPQQEQLMSMLMDPGICNFNLEESNAARKIVGKKLMSKIPDLRKKVLDQATSPCLGNYVWRSGVGPQMGYSFSKIHSIAYSFIGVQGIYLATNWNPIYWNTACLIVNSGSLEEIEEDEDTREKTTDYGKIAKAIGEITNRGIKISLIDINKSKYSFEPDIEHNEILFGLKALSGLNKDVIRDIIEKRPFAGIADFMTRCPQNKRVTLSLIKSGAFDKLEKVDAEEMGMHPRIYSLAYFISKSCEPKKKLNMQNFNGLITLDLIPEELDLQKRTFLFTKHLKANRKVGKYFTFDITCEEFYNKHFDAEKLEVINGVLCIQQTEWEKIYKREMEIAKEWIKQNHDDLLNQMNGILFKNEWEKYATGNISSYEMETLCFYYNEHELAHVDKTRYGIVDFSSLNPSAEVDYYWKRNGVDLPIFKINRIIGTILNKNDNKYSVTILTTDGVVSVKFTKDYYAMFKRQLSEKQSDGTKKIVEKGWFSRGVKILVAGYRRDDMFVAKTYKNNGFHQLYKITSVNEDGSIELVHDRVNTGDDNE